MQKRRCCRCGQFFLETEMLDLRAMALDAESSYACEGCLLSFEQDLFYGQWMPITRPRRTGGGRNGRGGEPLSIGEILTEFPVGFHDVPGQPVL